MSIPSHESNNSNSCLSSNWLSIKRYKHDGVQHIAQAFGSDFNAMQTIKHCLLDTNKQLSIPHDEGPGTLLGGWILIATGVQQLGQVRGSMHCMQSCCLTLGCSLFSWGGKPKALQSTCLQCAIF